MTSVLDGAKLSGQCVLRISYYTSVLLHARVNEAQGNKFLQVIILLQEDE